MRSQTQECLPCSLVVRTTIRPSTNKRRNVCASLHHLHSTPPDSVHSASSHSHTSNITLSQARMFPRCVLQTEGNTKTSTDGWTNHSVEKQPIDRRTDESKHIDIHVDTGTGRGRGTGRSIGSGGGRSTNTGTTTGHAKKKRNGNIQKR